MRPHVKTLIRAAALTAVAVIVFAGCANPGTNERAESATTFKTNLVAETERLIREAGGVLTLSNAVCLAHDRTLKLTQQDLEAKLARVNKATLFSVFLPTVTFNGNATLFSGSVSDAPVFGDARTAGASLNGGSMLVAQPVFTPVAWVMFAEAQYGIRIRDIVRERAEQLLDIQVAALFCRAAIASRKVGVYERFLESGAELEKLVTRLHGEDLALASDVARARARRAMNEASLTDARVTQENTRAALADILRLWPLAFFSVAGDSLLEIPALPEHSVEEWIWRGLLTRKDLYAGDQTVALRKAQVLEALAGFLPNVVMGGGGANVSLESVLVKGWAGSLIGAWSAFEGFRSVQQYRAARAQREAEFKLQEDRMLAVVVAVAEAYRHLLLAHEQAEAVRMFAEAARLDHAATERRYADGRETLSSVLDKLAVRDDAEVRTVQAEYGEALAAVQLRQAVGIGLFEKVEKEKECK